MKTTLDKWDSPSEPAMGYQVTSAYASAAAFATRSRQGELTKVDHPMPPHQRSIRFNSKFGSGTIVLRVQAAGPQCNSARTPKNTGTVQTPKTRRRAPRGQGTVASMDIMSKRIFSADMRFRYDSFQLSLSESVAVKIETEICVACYFASKTSGCPTLTTTVHCTTPATI